MSSDGRDDRRLRYFGPVKGTWIAFYYIQKGERLRRRIMSTTPASRSSAARMTRHRERRRQGTRCVTVDVSQSELDALVVRGYLSEGERDNGCTQKGD